MVNIPFDPYHLITGQLILKTNPRSLLHQRSSGRGAEMCPFHAPRRSLVRAMGRSCEHIQALGHSQYKTPLLSCYGSVAPRPSTANKECHQVMAATCRFIFIQVFIIFNFTELAFTSNITTHWILKRSMQRKCALHNSANTCHFVPSIFFLNLPPEKTCHPPWNDESHKFLL